MVIQYNTNLRFLLILHIYHFEKLYKLTAPVTINNYAMNVAIQKVYPCHQADSPMTNIFMVSGKTRLFSRNRGKGWGCIIYGLDSWFFILRKYSNRVIFVI